MGELESDLRACIARRSVVVVVGAGVSIGATNNNRVASWTGLLEHGLERCRAVVPGLDNAWLEKKKDLLSGDMDDLLSVAEIVASKLGSPSGGEYSRWLRSCFEPLHCEIPHRGVLKALRDLNLTIATTNYDGLIEEVTGRPAVTWRDGEG